MSRATCGFKAFFPACGKPACGKAKLPNGVERWYCVEHYDLIMKKYHKANR